MIIWFTTYLNYGWIKTDRKQTGNQVGKYLQWIYKWGSLLTIDLKKIQILKQGYTQKKMKK